MTINDEVKAEARNIKESAEDIIRLLSGEEPIPDTRIVVMLKKAPLRELKRYNKKGKMVMRIHGGLRNRIKAQAGEELFVIGDIIKVDGFRNYAYRLLRQYVNGKFLPPQSDSTARHPDTKKTDKDFFILARHVRA